MADSAGKWNIEKPDFWLGTGQDGQLAIPVSLGIAHFQTALKLLQLADILCDFWQLVN